MPTETRLTGPSDPAPVISNESPARDGSLGPLLSQLAQDSAALVKQEIALAKAEVRDSVRQTASGATRIAIGGAVAGVAGLVLTAFLVLLLGDLIGNYWLAALIVGVVLALIGGLLALAGVRRLRDMNVAPERTLQTLREDANWARREVQDLKRELKE